MNPGVFAQPGPEYRGTTLWMLNDRLEEAELRRQLRGFRDAGWGAVIDRTFNGLRTPYLSDEWKGLVRATIDEAARLGLRVWLQAGYMPGGVPDLPPESQQQFLVRAGPGHTPGDTHLASRDGYDYYARRRPHVVDLLSKRACAEYIRVSYTECLEQAYADHLGRTVETVWVDEPHFQAPDLPWSPELPDRFRALWGRDLRDELDCLFVERGDHLRTRHQYWRTVTAMLLEAYFAQIQAWCAAHHVAFGGHLMGEDTLQGQIGWTGACMPCYEHMSIPGIDHLTRSLKWPAERSFLLTPKQCSSVSNQLGKTRTLAEMYGVSSQGLDFEDRKRIGDWLLMLGVNERCYHGSFYTLRGRRKRIYAPHLGHQQPWWPDNRLMADYFARLCYLMRQGSYTADVLVLHPVESAWSRYEMSDAADPHDRVREPGPVRAMTDALILLSENLLAIHRGFDYGDESILARLGAVEGDRLRVGAMTYRVVILPELVTIRSTTLELLRRFRAAGGLILSAGPLPRRMDGSLSREPATVLGGLRQVRNTAPELREVLDALAPAATRLEGVDGSDTTPVWLHTRTDGDREIHILHNTATEHTVRARLRIRRAADLESWDPARGVVAPHESQQEPGETWIALRLEPGETRVVVAAPAASGGAPTATPRVASGITVVDRQTERTVDLPGPYAVRPDGLNTLPLDYCRYRTADHAWSESVPVIWVQETLSREGYRGRVRLRFAFHLEKAPEALRVVVEDAAEQSVSLNGVPLRLSGLGPYLDASFDVLDTGGAARDGENTLEIDRVFDPPTESAFHLGSLFHTSTGTEIESVYLAGRFAVRCIARESPVGFRLLSPGFRLAPMPTRSTGDLVADGFPFYAGAITLETSFAHEPVPAHRVFLALRDLDAVLARVSVNGSAAQPIAWRPYETDVTDLLQPGRNTVALTLVSSLRGLLGPHHRPGDEGDQVWSDSWSGLSGEGRRDTALRAGSDWALHRNDGSVFWTDDYLVPALGLGRGCCFVYRRAPRP